MTTLAVIERGRHLDEAAASFRIPPHNVEAEQAVLGAILVNNEACHRISEFLRAEHFYEPVHGRIYATCSQRIGNGMLADPVTLKVLFEEDAALRELDGARYLAQLARAAESIVNAVEYARIVYDLALKRSLIGIGEQLVNRAYDRANEAAGVEQIEEAERQLYELAQTGDVKGGFRAFPQVLTRTIEMVQSALHKGGRVTGVPTALKGVDDKLGGLQPSDLVILAGRPSMGKTALAVTMAANAAAVQARGPEAEGLRHSNYVVAVFSLEMSAEQLAMRLLAAEAQISSDELRRGELTDEEFRRVVRASTDLSGRPLFIDDTPALTIAALRTRARRLKRQHGLSLVVVDYLQLLRGVGSHSQINRVQEISEITQGLKALAKELNVAVLALSQLSRAVESREDKRPLLSDLRESGSIEQDADVVMFVYRDDYYQERAEPKLRPDESLERFQERYNGWFQRFQDVKNKADVIIAKQRNGPIGTVQLQFDPSYGRFRNPEFADYGDRLS
jgi:replicative DNA helicase